MHLPVKVWSPLSVSEVSSPGAELGPDSSAARIISSSFRRRSTVRNLGFLAKRKISMCGKKGLVHSHLNLLTFAICNMTGKVTTWLQIMNQTHFEITTFNNEVSGTSENVYKEVINNNYPNKRFTSFPCFEKIPKIFWDIISSSLWFFNYLFFHEDFCVTNNNFYIFLNMYL